MSYTADWSQILRLLPLIEAVARTGSVTGAADELGMPQPTASRGLARLAALVGVPLISRDGRGIVLTDAGKRLAEAAEDGSAIIRGGLADIRRSTSLADATVSIAFQTLLGESYIPNVLRRVKLRRPGIRVALRHGSREVCVRAAADREVDIALVADPPALRDASVIALYSEPLLAMAPADHPLASRTSVRPEELLAFDLIILEPGYGLHRSVQRLLAADGGRVTAAFEVGDYRTARGLAAAGLGVTILPPSPVYIDDGVREIPIDHPAARRDIGAIVRDSANPAVGEVVAVMRGAAVPWGTA